MPLSSVRAVVLRAAMLAALTGHLEAQTLAITGATVIDGTGRAPMPDAVVMIENGRITAVGPAAAVKVPAGTTRIAAGGKWVIPGMMDANLHLDLNIQLEDLIRYEDHYDRIVLEGTQIALKTGLTTVFDTWGPR